MSDSSSTAPVAESEFAYLPAPSRDMFPREEGLKEKLFRKTKENPFVPLGVLVTAGALIFGLREMKAGRTKNSQKMMRLRIFGQSATIVAILGGVLYGTTATKSVKGD